MAKIVEVQQEPKDNGGMLIKLVASSVQESSSKHKMILSENWADTYNGLGKTAESKELTFTGKTIETTFISADLSKFNKELFVCIDSGKNGNHDLSNVCCIFLNAPKISRYAVTEQNDLRLFTDRSTRDAGMAANMRCKFSSIGDSATAPVIAWSANLETYGLHKKASIEVKLSYSYRDATAEANVFGPNKEFTMHIAPPVIKDVSYTTMLTAKIETSPPAKLLATLNCENSTIAEEELTNNSGSYKWESLPTMDPATQYTVHFSAKGDLGVSKPSRNFHMITVAPIPESCEYINPGVKIHMAKEAVYDVNGTQYTGKTISLTSVPNTDPKIRMVRDNSYGPECIYKLKSPAYYNSGLFYKYDTKPIKSCDKMELTLNITLPAYNGNFFIAADKKLTITAEAFNPQSDVHKDYIALLAKANEAQVKAIRTAVLENMPMRAEDMLFYNYHYKPDSGYVDIWPGMRLLVEFAGYQYIPKDMLLNILGQGDASEYAALNGYVGTGNIAISVVERKGYLRFEPFVSSLVDNDWLTVKAPDVIKDNNLLSGGAGVFDLLFDGMKAQFIRLAYPKNVTSSATEGSLKFYDNVCLMAAANTQLLDSAMEYMDSASFKSFVPKVGIMDFRGRATVIPQIKITLNDSAHWVSVGTVFDDILHESAAIAKNATLSRQSQDGLCPILNAKSYMPLLAGDDIRCL
ncbi:MAG: hypothetical protein FWC15_03410 [Fibromonadales bacterium]|nr:hypothetical protein [Fibromonadales bacterium]